MLRLEVDSERVGRHMNAAVRRVAQRVNIPGFRKGKAPRAILQNYVGKDYLVEEAMESLVPEAVGDAVKQEEITPFATPRVNIEQTEPSVTIVATVPLQPTVVLGDYQSIRYDDQPDEVTDEDVDNLLMQLRRTQAYSVPVERAVQENDIVKIDLIVHADEELIWDVKDEEFQLILNVETYGEVLVGIYQGIVGMSTGDEKEFSFPVPEGGDTSRFAGKTTHVKVVLNDIREEFIPELDDAMAVTAGVPEVETAEQLTQHVRSQLEQSGEQRFLENIQRKLITDVVETSEFTISPIVLEYESQNVLQRHIRELQRITGREGQPVSADDISEEDINRANTIAERDIKNALVVEGLVKAENIEVTDDDIVAEIQRVNEAATSEEQKFDDNPSTRESIKSLLQRRRTIDKVVDIARGMHGETPTEIQETE